MGVFDGRSERVSGNFSGNIMLITKPKSLDFLLWLYGTLAKLTKFQRICLALIVKILFVLSRFFSFCSNRLPCHNLQKNCGSRFYNSLCCQAKNSLIPSRFCFSLEFKLSCLEILKYFRKQDFPKVILILLKYTIKLCVFGQYPVRFRIL